MGIWDNLIQSFKLEASSPEEVLAWVADSQAHQVEDNKIWWMLTNRGDVALVTALMDRWPEQIPVDLLGRLVTDAAEPSSLLVPLATHLHDHHPVQFGPLMQAALDTGVQRQRWAPLTHLLQTVPPPAFSDTTVLRWLDTVANLVKGSADVLAALLTEERGHSADYRYLLDQKAFEAGIGTLGRTRLDLLDVLWKQAPPCRSKAVFGLLSNPSPPLEKIRHFLAADPDVAERVHDLLNERLRQYTNPERDWQILDTLGTLVDEARQADWLQQHPDRLPLTQQHQQARQRQTSAQQAPPMAMARSRRRS